MTGFFEGIGQGVGGVIGAGSQGIDEGLPGAVQGAATGGVYGTYIGAGAGAVGGAIGGLGVGDVATVPGGAIAGGRLGGMLGAAGGAVYGGAPGFAHGAADGFWPGAEKGGDIGKHLDETLAALLHGFNKSKDNRRDAMKHCDHCAANEKVDDLEKRANVKQETKGKTRHGALPSGDADKEFDKLDPQNVRPIDTQYGPGRVGDLGNDEKVVVRPGYSGNPTEPSLDIQRPNGRNTEIRFPK